MKSSTSSAASYSPSHCTAVRLLIAYSLWIVRMWLVIAAVVVLLALIYWNGVKDFSILAEIPLNGPKPLPYVGSFLDILKFGGLHKTFMAYFKQYGRVYKMSLGRSPTIVVSDPEMVKQITVKEFSKFRNRTPPLRLNPPLGSGIFFARDGTWKRIRSTLNPTFSAAKLRQIVPLIEKSCDKLAMKMHKFAESGESVNCTKLFSLFALDVIMKAAFGYDADIQSEADLTFINRAKEAFKTPLLIRAFSLLPFSKYLSRFANPIGNLDYFVGIARSMIESRQSVGHDKTGRRDLLQLMLEAHQEELAEGLTKLSDEELAAQSVVFLLAGFETTGTTLSCAGYELATHPEIQDKLIQEVDKACQNRGSESLYDFVQKIEYLDQFISEVLREHGPAFNLLRTCNEEVVIEGVRFPKGIDVTIPNYTLHRDPDIWENPEEFNPDRFSTEAKEKRHPYAFIPFGIGPRQCIGMRFAMNEIKIGLCSVLEKFKFKRAPETIEIEKRAVILMRPKEDIVLKIVER